MLEFFLLCSVFGEFVTERERFVKDITEDEIHFSSLSTNLSCNQEMIYKILTFNLNVLSDKFIF